MADTPGAPRRYADPRQALAEFAENVLVVCPACTHRAHVRPVTATPPDPARGPRVFAPRRLVCPTCGYHREVAPKTVSYGAAVDPFFGQPLFLVTSCRGHELWAYNAEHVDVLRAWVGAALRDRTSPAPRGGDRWETQTLLESLPSWMTSAQNRDHVTKALDLLAALAAH